MANDFHDTSITLPPAFVLAALLSDRDLLLATARVAADERRTTAELLTLLAELDTRRLYLGEGYSSLFTYCTQRLRLSESAAYGRIAAARAVRRFPSLLMVDGDVTLTTIGLLAAHLTDDNHEALLDAARHASRRDVERLVASLHAQPDIPARMRRIPSHRDPGTRVPSAPERTDGRPLDLLTGPAMAERTAPESASAKSPVSPAPRPAVAPVAADRYLLRVTVSASTHAKFERARDLLRHSVPDGDPAVVIDRAFSVLLDHLERRKAGRVSRASSGRPVATAARRRHVPAAVRRAVWTRDQGRCAFVGRAGRCTETGFLEYHHVVPFAAGGTTDATNLELRCRAHNAYEATVHFAAAESLDGVTR